MILRREATFAGRVYDQQNFAFVFLQQMSFPLNVIDGKIKDRSGGGVVHLELLILIRLKGRIVFMRPVLDSPLLAKLQELDWVVSDWVVLKQAWQTFAAVSIRVAGSCWTLRDNKSTRR